MTLTLKNIFLFSFIIFLVGCSKYEPQFEGNYTDSLEGKLPAEGKVVAFAAGGDVYLADAFLEEITKIEDSGNVQIVSINNDHTKVIFRRTFENIQIFDIESNSIIDEIPNSTGATWFDFHANNETVFFLSGSILETYGPDVLKKNPIDIKNIAPANSTVQGVTVLKNGNFIYSISTSNDNKLILTDGVEELEDFWSLEGFRKHLRLNKHESYMWGSTSNKKVYVQNIIDIIGNIIPTHYTNSSFGVPSGDETGYLATPATRGGDDIQLPGSTSAVLVPNTAKITSIDY